MKIQRRNNLLCVFDVTNLKMRVGVFSMIPEISASVCHMLLPSFLFYSFVYSGYTCIKSVHNISFVSIISNNGIKLTIYIAW